MNHGETENWNENTAHIKYECGERNARQKSEVGNMHSEW